MPPKRKVETVEDKTEVPPAKKTSEEESPPISPDKGATGETTPSPENKVAHYKEEYNNAAIKLLKNISMQNPELGRDIVIEALYKYRKDKEKWLNKLCTKFVYPSSL